MLLERRQFNKLSLHSELSGYVTVVMDVKSGVS